MTGPLDGLRVVDCSLGFAGPRATGLLADYGADVIWVEPPGGDLFRVRAPAAASVFNRGKRSVILDVGQPDQRERLDRLLDGADVCVHTWPPGSAEAWGLDPTTLRVRFPTLVICTISAFGAGDPRDTVAFHEALIHAVVGTMAEQPGFRDGPIFEALPFAGIGASYLAVIGILAALHRRWIDGHGRHVETSLCDGALAYLSMMWGQSDVTPAGKPAPGLHRLVARSFLCSDGTYLGVHTGAVGAFGRLMALLGLDDRIPSSADGLDLGVPLTDDQQRILETDLPGIFAGASRETWERRLRDIDVCAVEHLAVTEVFDQPQVIYNRMVITVDDPVLGPVEQVAPPATLTATPASVRGPAPAPGRHGPDAAFAPSRWSPPHRRETPDRGPLLAGVRIVDLGAWFAGPYSSRLLADLGADVVKVEPVAGDPLRGMERPFFSAQAGKRAVAMDLKDERLRPAIRALLEDADVVHHNLRPGAAERLGVGYEQVRSLNADVVYAYAPGWGSTGPDRLRQSFAPMMSGYVGVSFECAGQLNPPLFSSGNEDPGNGLLGATAMLLALLHRQRTGEGQLVEHPQLNATMAHMAHAVRRVDGAVVGAGLLDPMQYGVGPYERLYQTADGWVCVVAYTDAERAALLGVAGVDDGDDAVLDLRLAGALSSRKTSELIDELAGARVPAVEPVGLNRASLLTDPDHQRIGRVAECRHPEKGTVREIGVLVRVSDAAVVPHRLAPALGADTDEILASLGYGVSIIDELRRSGVIR